MKLEETETKLDNAFNMALEKPVGLSRGSKRFVLMNEDEYLNLKDELLCLQRNLRASLDVREGNSVVTKDPASFEELFNNVSSRATQKISKN
jgi:hypothetical protein